MIFYLKDDTIETWNYNCICRFESLLMYFMKWLNGDWGPSLKYCHLGWTRGCAKEVWCWLNVVSDQLNSLWSRAVVKWHTRHAGTEWSQLVALSSLRAHWHLCGLQASIVLLQYDQMHEWSGFFVTLVDSVVVYKAKLASEQPSIELLALSSQDCKI